MEASENDLILPKHPISSLIILTCTPKTLADFFHQLLPKSLPTQRSVPQEDWDSTQMFQHMEKRWLQGSLFNHARRH